MISIREFKKNDLLLIKSQIFVFLICVFLLGGMFWSMRYVNATAKVELQQVRTRITGIRQSMDTIRRKAEKADQYVERYTNLQASGVVGDEDRLQLLELIAGIRARHQLFPISININEQTGLSLPFQTTSTEGSHNPVQLRSSLVEISFPLLHESDLTRLLDDLLASDYFLQPIGCKIADNNDSNTNYTFLDKHFSASCSLNWYTFYVTPSAGAQRQ